jgi:predicted nucleic acid-binding protein
VVVIADTGPINYLVLIAQIDILPTLFGTVILPSAVSDELADIGSPSPVRDWIANPPSWLDVRVARREETTVESLRALDAGEVGAILLAIELHADLLLMDDREGVIAARSEGFAVTGTLGVLSLAAESRLLDLS